MAAYEAWSQAAGVAFVIAACMAAAVVAGASVGLARYAGTEVHHLQDWREDHSLRHHVAAALWLRVPVGARWVIVRAIHRAMPSLCWCELVDAAHALPDSRGCLCATPLPFVSRIRPGMVDRCYCTPWPADVAATLLAEWDLDRDALDHAQLCEAYPHECEFDDAYDTPDPWGRSRRVCLTHTNEGKHP